MAKLPETFNFPDKDKVDMEELLLVLNRMYIDLARAINEKPDIYQRNTDGLTTETFLSRGTINLNTTTRKVEMLTQFNNGPPTTVTWTTLS